MLRADLACSVPKVFCIPKEEAACRMRAGPHVRHNDRVMVRSVLLLLLYLAQSLTTEMIITDLTTIKKTPRMRLSSEDRAACTTLEFKEMAPCAFDDTGWHILKP